MYCRRPHWYRPSSSCCGESRFSATREQAGSWRRTRDLRPRRGSRRRHQLRGGGGLLFSLRANGWPVIIPLQHPPSLVRGRARQAHAATCIWAQGRHELGPLCDGGSHVAEGHPLAQSIGRGLSPTSDAQGCALRTAGSSRATTIKRQAVHGIERMIFG
jgi:hypothetical protein